MTYDHVISDVVKVVEAVGAAIMVVGGLWALVGYGWAMARTGSRRRADYHQLRR